MKMVHLTFIERIGLFGIANAFMWNTGSSR